MLINLLFLVIEFWRIILISKESVALRSFQALYIRICPCWHSHLENDYLIVIMHYGEVIVVPNTVVSFFPVQDNSLIWMIKSFPFGDIDDAQIDIWLLFWFIQSELLIMLAQ